MLSVGLDLSPDIRMGITHYLKGEPFFTGPFGNLCPLRPDITILSPTKFDSLFNISSDMPYKRKKDVNNLVCGFCVTQSCVKIQ